jgi:hypothetical protein
MIIINSKMVGCYDPISNTYKCLPGQFCINNECINPCGVNGGTYCPDETQYCQSIGDGNYTCVYECEEDVDCTSGYVCVNNGCVWTCEDGGDYCPPEIDDITGVETFKQICVVEDKRVCKTKCEYDGDACAESNEKCIIISQDDQNIVKQCFPPCDLAFGYCPNELQACVETPDNFQCIDPCIDDNDCTGSSRCVGYENKYCQVPCAESGGYYCEESKICIETQCLDLCGNVKGYCYGEDIKCLPYNIHVSDAECETDETCIWQCYPPCKSDFGYCNENELCQSIGNDNYTCTPLCDDVYGPCLDPNQLCVATENKFECQNICGLDVTNNGPCSGNRLCSEKSSTLLCSENSTVPCVCSTICGDVDGPCPDPNETCILQDCGLSGGCSTPFKCTRYCGGITEGPCQDANDVCYKFNDENWRCLPACGTSTANGTEGICPDPNQECIESSVSGQFICSDPCGIRQGRCDGINEICVPDKNYGGYKCVTECNLEPGACANPNQICDQKNFYFVCVDPPESKSIITIVIIVIVFILIIALIIIYLYKNKNSNISST